MDIELLKGDHSNSQPSKDDFLQIGQPRLDGYMPVVWPNGRMARFALHTNVSPDGDEITGIVIVYPDHGKVSFDLFRYRRQHVPSLVVETRYLEAEGRFPSAAKAGVDVVAILGCETSIEREHERCGKLYDLGQLKESAKQLAARIQSFLDP